MKGTGCNGNVFKRSITGAQRLTSQIDNGRVKYKIKIGSIIVNHTISIDAVLTDPRQCPVAGNKSGFIGCDHPCKIINVHRTIDRFPDQSLSVEKWEAENNILIALYESMAYTAISKICHVHGGLCTLYSSHFHISIAPSIRCIDKICPLIARAGRI